MGNRIVTCDKNHIAEVLSVIWNCHLESLGIQGHLQHWRRDLALSHHVFSGFDYTMPRVTSVQALLDKYSIPGVASKVESNMTALHYAAYENEPNLVELLVTARAELEAEDSLPIGEEKGVYGCTPLFCASLTQSTRAVVALLKCDADPNHASLSGEGITSLHIAAIQGFVDVVKLLIAFRADVNRRAGNRCYQSSRRTLPSLSLAVLRDCPRLAFILLQARADPLLESLSGEWKGKNALDLAQHLGQTLVTQVLLVAAEKPLKRLTYEI